MFLDYHVKASKFLWIILENQCISGEQLLLHKSVALSNEFYFGLNQDKIVDIFVIIN